MDSAIRVLHYAIAGGLAALGLAALFDWRRSRGFSRRYLALGLGLLGLAAILGRVNYLTAYRYRFLEEVALTALVFSGLGFLLFRDTFIPLRRSVKIMAVGATVVAAGLGVATGIPRGPEAIYDRGDFAALLLILGVWIVFVGEAAIRFWRTSRDLPSVQKARLRAMSLGYLGIAVVFIVAGSSSPGERSSVLTIVIQLFVLLAIPLLYMGLSPPRWVRHLWRSSEWAQLLEGMEDLIVFVEDRGELVHRSLERVKALMGAEAGVVVGPDEEILAVSNIDEMEACSMVEEITGVQQAQIVWLSSGNSVLSVPWKVAEGRGRFLLVAGPFTPYFGSEEIETVKGFVTSFAASYERVRLEEQLQRREQALAEAQEVAHLGSWEWEVGSEEVWGSDELHRICGLETSESLASDFLIQLVHPEDREEVEIAARGALEGRGSFAIDHRLVHPDGSERILHSRGKVVVDDSGSALKIVGTAQDVTEQRMAQRELARVYEKEKLAADKLRELSDLQSDFLRTISHELRTPLTSIMGFSNTLVRRWDLIPEDHRWEFLERIELNADRLNNLISELLSFGEARNGGVVVRVMPVNLNELLEEAVEAWNETIGDHTFHVDCRGPVQVLGDRSAIMRMLRNIVSNAVKFSPPGSSIWIRTEPLENGDEVCITVEDEGPGIPPGEEDRIFDRFYRVHRDDEAPDGTGIGLSIVREFARAQKGRVWVERRPEGGSAFKFTLRSPMRQHLIAS